MKKNILLTLTLMGLLVGSSYITAWTGPTASAPNGNVASPINIGATTQVKTGDLGVADFIADSLLSLGTVQSNTQMRSPEYCDENGIVCIDSTEVAMNALPTCTNGQTLVADAAGSWVCGAATTPPTTLWLVNNQHSETQCTSLGGTVVTGASSEKFCRFNTKACPSGWAKYLLWTTYSPTPVSGTCTQGDDDWNYNNVTCNVNRAWANAPGVTGSLASGMCAGKSCTPPPTQIGCY